MRRYILVAVGGLVFALMGVACAPASVESVVPTEPPIRADSTATETQISVSTEVVPTITPIPGLSMEVGANYHYVDNSILVAVPGGEFIMGADGGDNPEHPVSLSDFWIYSTNVTNQQYGLCESLGECTSPHMESNPTYADRAYANEPVVGVTYEQAVAYCNFVKGRLPTEAEWEKTARDPQGGKYPWGETAPSCDLLNYDDCVGALTSVVSYPDGRSYYGALDMAGNVFEWVADWYDAEYYLGSPYNDPQGPADGTTRSIRSSSYQSGSDLVVLTNRYFEDPQNHRADLGFRCVIPEPTYFAPFCEVPAEFGSQGAVSSESCPEIDITQAQFCIGALPATNVTFVGPADAIIDSSNCVPSTNPELFTCQSPGTIVSITTDCQLNLTGNPSCPPGYSFQGDQCVAAGRVGDCLEGWEYNSDQQCCAAQNTSGLDLVSPLCQVGMFYSIKQNACLPYLTQETISKSLIVEFVAFCTVVTSDGNGGDDNSDTTCQATQEDCGTIEFIPGECCCSYDGKTCDFDP